MFINIRLSKLFKIFFVFVVIFMLILFGISIFKIFSSSIKSKTYNTSVNSEVVELTAKNYTNALKAVHDNIDSYVGTKIHFTGYIYRLYDFNKNQFVLARNMLINSNNQSVVVGFLCESEKAKDFENNTWVEIIGTIENGNYHGNIPIIKVETIKQVDCPKEEFVYPPDDGFIPTNTII